MENFDSFEDFGNEKINEAAMPAPFFDSVNQMNAILASDDVAGKMEMMFVSSIYFSTKYNTWVVKSKDRPKFYLKVTLTGESTLYGDKKYVVNRVEKIAEMP